MLEWRNKRIDKKQYKLTAGECRICKDDIHDLLDVHRIYPGSVGGQYTENNCCSLCVKCHRLVHKQFIIVDRWYPSTKGYLLRIIENGVERFV